MRRFGVPLQRVRGRVRKMKGGFSGGTIASLLATLEDRREIQRWRGRWPTRLR